MSAYIKYVPPSLGGGGGTGVQSVGLADGSTTPIYSISGSPVTSTGTLTFTLNTELANKVFAGPTTGAAAQPTFRSLVAADLPTGNITDTGTDGITITGGTGAIIGGGVTLSQHVAGASNNGYLSSTDWSTFNSKQSALTFSDSLVNNAGTVTLVNDSATPGNSKYYGTNSGGTLGYYSSVSGTVTSVALSVPASSLFSVSGSPVTSSGTLALSTTGTLGGLPYFSSTTQLNNLAIGSTGNILTVSGGLPVWAAPATSGTVTSVALTVPTFLSVSGSPITTSGTLAVSLSGTALPILNGGTGQTTAAAAFNALNPMTTTGDLIYESGANTASRLAVGSTGNVLTVSGGVPTWAAPATSGTVTSVALSVPATSIFSVSGSPVTTSGTLALATTGTSGGLPYFSSTSQLTSSALLTQYGVLYGGGAGASPASTAAGTANYPLVANSGSAPTFQLLSLTAGVTGVLPIANGGTDNGTLAVTAGGVLYTDGTKFQNVGAGTSGYLLQSNGVSAPTWVTPPATGVTSFSFTNQDNVTGTVTNSTTTPTLALAPTSATPAASSFASWDANKNLSANNLVNGFTTTATAAGTTTLTIASTCLQYFTGTTTQTVLLPTTSVVAGNSYVIVNLSTGVVTVQSSGANTIQAMAANTQLVVTALVSTPTTAANWNATYQATSITAPVNPTITTKVSGSGNYTAPTGAQFIIVRMVGGGGGGGGTGTGTPQPGSAGNASTFGSSLLTANGGAGGGQNGSAPGVGGTATALGGSAIGTTLAGGGGTNGAFGTGATSSAGGTGGASFFGGAGVGGIGGTAGAAGQTNTGGGGGGAGGGSTFAAASGGGSGAFVEAILFPTASQIYAYVVGASSSGGSAGTSGFAGGAGGSGYIEITEYYSNLSISGTTSVAAGTFLAGPTSGSNANPTFRALQTPTIQKFTSGSSTYTTATGALYIKVQMIGGGGGGGGSGSGSGAGANGGDTTFGTLTAGKGGGAGAGGGSSAVGSGGTNSGSPNLVNAPGAGGSYLGAQGNASQTTGNGGNGASSYFSGGGYGGCYGASVLANSSANANSGAGGGGGAGNYASFFGASGGGAGGYLEHIFSSPAATYSYGVGGGGAGGTIGTGTAAQAGGNGGSGVIIVTEFYQ